MYHRPLWLIPVLFLMVSMSFASITLAWGADLVQKYRPRNPITGGVQIDIYYLNDRYFATCTLSFAASWVGTYGFVTASHCYNYSVGNVWYTHQPNRATKCFLFWCQPTNENLISNDTWGSVLQDGNRVYFDFAFLPATSNNVLTTDQVLPPQVVIVDGSRIVKLTIKYFASYSYVTSGSSPRIVYKTGRSTGTTMLAYDPKHNVTPINGPYICYSTQGGVYICAHWIYMYRPSSFGLKEPSLQKDLPIVCAGDSGSPVFEYDGKAVTIIGFVSAARVDAEWNGLSCASGDIHRRAFVLVVPVYGIPYIELPPGVSWR